MIKLGAHFRKFFKKKYYDINACLRTIMIKIEPKSSIFGLDLSLISYIIPD